MINHKVVTVCPVGLGVLRCNLEGFAFYSYIYSFHQGLQARLVGMPFTGKEVDSELAVRVYVDMAATGAEL